jgi:hypothetical protein
MRSLPSHAENDPIGAFRHLLGMVDSLFWYFIIIVAVLLGIYLYVAYRKFKKSLVNMKKDDPNMDFSSFFPVIDKKNFIPAGWSVKKDDEILYEACTTKQTYLGWKLEKGKTVPILIKDKDRTYHCQIVGTTGSGKTETLWNIIAQDLIKGYGCCIVDPKADDDFLERFLKHCKACGLMDKVYFFSLMYPSYSHIYNPVQFGTPEEITERIINACNIENEYYKKLQFNFLLYSINILRTVHPYINLHTVIDFLKNYRDQEWVKEQITDRTTQDLSPYLKETYKIKDEGVSGILADLNQVSEGQFSHILNGQNQINLKQIMNQGNIVLFQLPVMKFSVIGKSIGKMLLQDIQSVVGGRQSTNTDPTFTQKNFYPVFIDEFFSMAYPSFVELINKARSANVAIHLGHQSLADLSQVSKEFKEAVFENTNLKFVAKQNDAASAEEFAKSFGTYQTHKETLAVEKGLLFNRSSKSSYRETEQFLIHPNLIKTASVGRGVVRTPTGQAAPCTYRMFHRLKDVGNSNIKQMLEWIPKRTGEISND